MSQTTYLRRNIGIIAHIDAGKTTVTERILYNTHKISRMGNVHDGTATMDYLPEEQNRGITISAAMSECSWNGYYFQIIDTPGHIDFIIEVERSLRVLDGAIGVFCCVKGVEAQSETVWQQSKTHKIPKIIFLNKIDRQGADFTLALKSLEKNLSIIPVSIVIANGSGEDFKSLYHVINQTRLEFVSGEDSEICLEHALNEDEKSFLSPWRDKLFEQLCDVDEDFLAQYIDCEDIANETIHALLRKHTLLENIVPVFIGSALNNQGIQPLLDAVIAYLPAPEEKKLPVLFNRETGRKYDFKGAVEESFLGFIFKIVYHRGNKEYLFRMYAGSLQTGDLVYNVSQKQKLTIESISRLHANSREEIDSVLAGDLVALQISGNVKTGDTISVCGAEGVLEEIRKFSPVLFVAVSADVDDEDRMREALSRYVEEDPSLFFIVDETTGENILSGMGDLHIQVILERLKREEKILITATTPEVVYYTTVMSEGIARGKFENQAISDVKSEIVLRMYPRSRGEGNSIFFSCERVAESAEIFLVVEETINEYLCAGKINKYAVEDVGIVVEECMASSADNFLGLQTAIIAALYDFFRTQELVILEPWMNVIVSVRDEFVGDVVHLLGSVGAKIENMYEKEESIKIESLAKLSSLFDFSVKLRSVTKGRGSFSMSFAHFIEKKSNN